MLFRLVFCSFFFAVISAAGPEVENPYKNVELLPFNPHGWYSNARRIEEIFKSRKIQTVVEVGSWLGCSTRHIATLLPQGGKVYAVDHWLGSTEHVGNEFVPQLYQQFLSNVIHAKLTDRIVPVKMESVKAAQHLKDLKVDLVYIDGAHDTESVLQDLRAWYPFVKGHGVICGDDWTCSTVADAVTLFAKENHLKIFQLRCFWKLEEN
jgi:predicted O-methyltransferase YrrM